MGQDSNNVGKVSEKTSGVEYFLRWLAGFLEFFEINFSVDHMINLEVDLLLGRFTTDNYKFCKNIARLLLYQIFLVK